MKWDVHGKAQFKGSLPQEKPFLSQLGIVSDEMAQELAEECRSAFTVKELQNGESYSSGSTFFIGCNDKPSCPLERLALDIFDMHVPSSGQKVSFDSNRSGAEWWTQVIDSRDDIGAHWDRDYGIEEEEAMNVHPHLATVTYLSAAGGPTLVFDRKGFYDSNTDISNGSGKWVFVSFPKIGKHISFGGSLLHAAPATFDGADDDDDDDDDKEGEEINSEYSDDGDNQSQGIERVTFLVNIWINHIPTHACRFRNCNPNPNPNSSLDHSSGLQQPRIVSATNIEVENVLCVRHSICQESDGNSSNVGNEDGARHWNSGTCRALPFVHHGSEFKVFYTLPADSTALSPTCVTRIDYAGNAGVRIRKTLGSGSISNASPVVKGGEKDAAHTTVGSTGDISTNEEQQRKKLRK